MSGLFTYTKNRAGGIQDDRLSCRVDELDKKFDDLAEDLNVDITMK